MHGYKGDVANERGWCTGCQYATPLAAQVGSYTDGDGKVHAYADTTTTYAIGERYMYTFNDGTTKTSDNNCVNTGNHRGYHRSIGPPQSIVLLQQLVVAADAAVLLGISLQSHQVLCPQCYHHLVLLDDVISLTITLHMQ